MQIKNLGDLLVEQVKDLYSSEKQIETAYSKWLGALESSELTELFRGRIETARQRQATLKEIASRLGSDASGHKCEGTEGLLKEGDGFLDDAETGAVKDAGIIANAQRVEHYGIAGYGCAQTYAKTLGHEEIHDTLETLADDAGTLDQRMTELAERRLNQEAATA